MLLAVATWPPVAAVANSDEQFNLGVTFQRESHEASAPTEKMVLLERAIVHFGDAGTKRSDFYRAQFAWGSCLYELTQLTSNAAQRLAYAKAAEGRFAVASRCADADWMVYHAWGSLLVHEAQATTTEIERQTKMLLEARTKYEASRKLVAYRGDRAKIEIDLSKCEYLLAERSRDQIERRTLYQQVATDLDAATRGSERAKTAEVYSLWGAAFLQLGKLNDDHMLIRQGIERLLTGLETGDGKDAQSNYNLACAYALLGQTDAGLRHLHACLANDPRRVFYKIAASDQDLNGLRSTPEFNRIFGSEPLDPSSPLLEPQPLSH